MVHCFLFEMKNVQFQLHTHLAITLIEYTLFEFLTVLPFLSTFDTHTHVRCGKCKQLLVC